MQKLRVISNLPMLGSVTNDQFEIVLRHFSFGSWNFREAFSLFRESYDYDFVMLNGAPRVLLLMALFKWFFPLNRCRLVVLDILLFTPRNPKQKLVALIIRIMLKKVDLIILYYRNTSGLERVYSIPPSKFRYIPFKINNIDIISRTTPADEGYIFCGGKTRRDFTCLMEAVRGSDLPVKIVTTANSDIAEHGSYLDQSAMPENVEAVILDGSPERFIELMANARVVVMPIINDISGAGIGVCIMAMALRKCVVISEIPGTSDILPEDSAVIVPPANANRLGEALTQVYHDAGYRQKIADNGYRYASPLGGEENLMASIAGVLYEDICRRGSN